MKEQVEIEGFRFQVYCNEDKVHIHSPEEMAKVEITNTKASELMKRFISGLEKMKTGISILFDELKMKRKSVTTIELQLGKEKRIVGRDEFIEKMKEFRRLVEVD